MKMRKLLNAIEGKKRKLNNKGERIAYNSV